MRNILSFCVATFLTGYLAAAMLHAGRTHLRHRQAGVLFLAACAALTLGMML